jgi:precorrin-6A/cobalt-precorrin-6A reductase
MEDTARHAQILMLGGAGEAPAVLALLRGRGDPRVRIIWDGPPPMGAPSELHGVTPDRNGIAQALRDGGFTHLLDVTHGFAGQISADAAGACADAGAAYAVLRRPAWTAQAGDRWTDVADMAAASAAIAPFARVFTNVGRALLPGLAGFRGQLFVRQTTQHDAAPVSANMHYIFGSPPFTHDNEVALLRDLGVDAVLFRNTGGAASDTKVTAARTLGLGIVMLARPAAPAGTHLPDVQAVARWADTL